MGLRVSMAQAVVITLRSVLARGSGWEQKWLEPEGIEPSPKQLGRSAANQSGPKTRRAVSLVSAKLTALLYLANICS